MVCVPFPTFFAVFRRWRTKLMRRENGTKLKNLTFDLNLLLAPTRAHQVFICICFLVVSLFMLACLWRNECLMAQRVLSNKKQHEGASRWCFKCVYCDAQNGDPTIFFFDWHVIHRRIQKPVFISWANVGAKIFGRL